MFVIEMVEYKEALEKAVLKVLAKHEGKWIYVSDILQEVVEEFPPLKPLNVKGREAAVGKALARLKLMRKRAAKGALWFVHLSDVKMEKG